MKRSVIWLWLGLCLAPLAPLWAASPNAPAARLNWPIQPGRSLAFVPLDISEAALNERFGPFNVQSTQIKLDAGDPYPASVLFPRDGDKRITLVWRDPVKRSGIAVAVVRGQRSFWSLPGQISLGTGVATLESRNGRPLLLAGIGPNQGGHIVSWNNGALSTALAKVTLYVADYNFALLSASAQQALAAGVYPSTVRAVQLLNPAVSEFRVQFSAPALP
ncbi:MAG: hypothetical protein RI925_1520 [Pseudomonadota bacterium]|jgi:hypothetical protein